MPGIPPKLVKFWQLQLSGQSLRSMTPGYLFAGPLAKHAEYAVGAALCCSNQKDRVA